MPDIKVGDATHKYASKNQEQFEDLVGEIGLTLEHLASQDKKAELIKLRDVALAISMGETVTIGETENGQAAPKAIRALDPQGNPLGTGFRTEEDARNAGFIVNVLPTGETVAVQQVHELANETENRDRKIKVIDFNGKPTDEEVTVGEAESLNYEILRDGNNVPHRAKKPKEGRLRIRGGRGS